MAVNNETGLTNVPRVMTARFATVAADRPIATIIKRRLNEPGAPDVGSSLSRGNYLASIIRRLPYGNGDRKWEWTLSRDRGCDQLIGFSCCLHYTRGNAPSTISGDIRSPVFSYRQEQFDSISLSRVCN